MSRRVTISRQGVPVAWISVPEDGKLSSCDIHDVSSMWALDARLASVYPVYRSLSRAVEPLWGWGAARAVVHHVVMPVLHDPARMRDEVEYVMPVYPGLDVVGARAFVDAIVEAFEDPHIAWVWSS